MEKAIIGFCLAAMFVFIVGMSYGLSIVRESVSAPGYLLFCFTVVVVCLAAAKSIDRRDGQ